MHQEIKRMTRTNKPMKPGIEETSFVFLFGLN